MHDVQRWLTSELKQMGVANAAGVALQLLTGMVVFRPIAVLGTRWAWHEHEPLGEQSSPCAEPATPSPAWPSGRRLLPVVPADACSRRCSHGQVPGFR